MSDSTTSPKVADLAATARLCAGLDQVRWDDVLNAAAEIVVFGSRAAGVNSASSDLDVLCIGEGKRRKSGHLDLIWKPERERDSQAWLSSELAGHVAKFGIWISGDDSWRGEVKTGADAARHKENRILNLAAGLDAHWNRLHPDFRMKYLVSLRREIQRLIVLREREAVPPTPLLDQAWEAGDTVVKDWLEAARDIRTGDRVAADRLVRIANLICGARDRVGACFEDSGKSLVSLAGAAYL
jgi:hypothetical protein